jgi:DNA mismatch endonuclease (patch repair protein)
MDIWSKRKRSEVMSHIRSQNTKPEIVLRSALHTKGFRFRVHRRDLPGRPDIVFPRHRTIVFVHGCFWHLHKGCRDGTIPKARHSYWKRKLTKNVKRDILHKIRLRKEGWRVVTVWECEIEKKLGTAIDRVEGAVQKRSRRKPVL